MKSLRIISIVSISALLFCCLTGCTTKVTIRLVSTTTESNTTQVYETQSMQDSTAITSEVFTSLSDEHSFETSMYTDEASQTTVITEPATQAPVKQDVTLSGRNDAKLTLHTNGTYDFDAAGYYLSTADYPALKALLLIANSEQKALITEIDGAKAFGPIHLHFSGDTYTIANGTMSLSNSVPVHVDGFEWDVDAISTVTNNGNGYTIAIKGDNGMYKFDFSEFELSSEQTKALGY